MKTVSESQWISALLHPRTHVRIEMLKHPFSFATTPEWDTREKQIREHLIYSVARGACKVTAAGSNFTLNADELCWVCPDVKFRFFSSEGRPSIIQRFRLIVTHGKQVLRLPWSARVFPHASEAMEWARMLVEEEGAPGSFSAQRLRALTALFSMSVFDRHRKEARRKGLSSEICQRLSAHVRDHMSERLNPGDLARVAQLSPDYFSRQFRQSYGLPPREWLVRQRLHHAALLLTETDGRVSEIATKLGYADIYLFSRQFKREFGHSPNHWRKIKSLQD